jgi:hypothetical protein
MTGRFLFENANEPEQPCPGVYRWYVLADGKDVTIYVGRAGHRGRQVSTPSTLRRGLQEAQRSCVTSDSGQHLDTDFVVGTALLVLREKGYVCRWQHLSDDPTAERAEWTRFKPLLQPVSPHLNTTLRLRKPGRGARWSGHDIEQATELLSPRMHDLFRRAAL